MAPLRYAAKFDPFFSLDCDPMPSTLAKSKERKGSNFAIWQPCTKVRDADQALQESEDEDQGERVRDATGQGQGRRKAHRRGARRWGRNQVGRDWNG